jgi:hypothetical protein
MNAITSTAWRPQPGATLGLAACTVVLLLLWGCHNAPGAAGSAAAATADEKSAPAGAADPEAKGKAPAEDEPAAGVELKPEEVEKSGIVTEEARPLTREPEVSGFGVVLAHETIAQAVAELRTAEAAARQSRSAFERSKRLAGTPGAMPADTQETAERQATADQAALSLAKQRLSSTFGQNPPWKTREDSPELLALASGETKLVHLTFPLGSLGDASPARVRLAHINASQSGKSWESRSIWGAPADATVPGKSFFATLKGADASEGDHLLTWASVGAPEPGVLVPASAVVVSQGKFWCYVEKKPGTFERVELDPSRPTADGYFVTQGISAGDKIVTAAAGQLLAREMNPSTEAE